MKKMLVALKTPSNVLLLAHSQIVGYILAFTVLVFPPAAWAQVPRVEEPLEAIPVVVIPGLNTPEDDLLEEALSGAFTLEMAQWINEHPQVDIFNYVWPDHDPTKDAIFLTNTGDSWSVELVDSTVVPDEGNSHIVFSGEFQFVNRFPLENYEPSAQRESTEIIAGWIIDTGAEPMPSKLVIGMLLSLPFVDDAGVETIIHSLMLMGWDNNSSRAEKRAIRLAHSNPLPSPSPAPKPWEYTHSMLLTNPAPEPPDGPGVDSCARTCFAAWRLEIRAAEKNACAAYIACAGGVVAAGTRALRLCSGTGPGFVWCVVGCLACAVGAAYLCRGGAQMLFDADVYMAYANMLICCSDCPNGCGFEF